MYQTSHQRWWKSGRAAIYNRYLKTAGGGERSSLECARALEDLGFEIFLITDPNTDLKIASLISSFGINPRSHWHLVELASEEDIKKFCKENHITIFLNHTFANYMPSPVDFGVYVLMFPHVVGEEQLKAIRSYRHIFSNSEFTKLHVLSRWGADLPITVLPPPIATIFFDSAKNACIKSKLILNVGRFNVDGHSKCQKEVIESFLRLKKDGILDSEWRLAVVGQLNEGKKNKDYFDKCAAYSSESVFVKQNVPIRELIALYQEAAVLFQFTGFGIDYGISPERCEHFGLVAIDALCFGTIPVVYDRSGAGYIIRWGETGYTFRNYKELALCMSHIASDYGTRMHTIQMQHCRIEAQKFSYGVFRKEVERSLLS